MYLYICKWRLVYRAIFIFDDYIYCIYIIDDFKLYESRFYLAEIY
jgi:hypothetical protein